MRPQVLVVTLVVLLGCNNDASRTGAQTSASAATGETAQAAAAPAPHGNYVFDPNKKDGEKTVADVAVGSPEHTTLVSALKAADLVDSLASPGGAFTVFAPTNAAFDKLPKGTLDDLMKPEKKAALTSILEHHTTLPALERKDLHDGDVLTMADGKKVTIHVKDGKVKVDDANVVTSISCRNGIVYVVDAVLLPPA